MDRRRKANLCFTYRKEGYRANTHQEKRKRKKQEKKLKRKKFNATSQPGYNAPIELYGFFEESLDKKGKGKERPYEERRKKRYQILEEVIKKADR
jgi:hypothetical protein